MSRIVLTVLFVLFSSCSGDNPVENAAQSTVQLVIFSGANQVGLQHTDLDEPIGVRLVNSDNARIANRLLRARAISGGGTVSSENLTTDQNGEVRLVWRLGDLFTQELEIWDDDAEAEAVRTSATARFRYTAPPDVGDGWPVASIADQTDTVERLSLGIDEIRKGTYPEVHSVLVVVNGELVLETYFPGHDSNGQLVNWGRNTAHEVQSASKSFRSMLIGIAVDKGFIQSVDQPLTDFFPAEANLLQGDKTAITLDHQLTMSTGLAWDEWTFPFGDSRNTLSTMYALPYIRWHEYVLGRDLAFSPGTQFVYNTGASIMLNRVIMHAFGTNLASFVRQYYTDLVESDDLPGVGSPLGANTTPRDMAKFGQVYLSGGFWKNSRVISEEWIQKSFESRFETSPGVGYGYQWWNRTLSTPDHAYKTYYASGNGGQFVFVIPDANLVFVSTGGNFGSSTMNQVFRYAELFVLPAFEN